MQTETTVTQTYLYIVVSHKTAEEMADLYGFSEEQRQQLSELLAEENNSLWTQVLYGISVGDGEIVTVALSQVGNIGGQPYWSWYGFDGRVEWCACFVSWCANECGYIDAGVIPKFAGCVNGVQWFKDRGQWQDTVKVDATTIVEMHNELRDTPKTGDDFNLSLWAGLGAAFAIGAGALCVVGLKRKKKED